MQFELYSLSLDFANLVDGENGVIAIHPVTAYIQGSANSAANPTGTRRLVCLTAVIRIHKKDCGKCAISASMAP